MTLKEQIENNLTLVIGGFVVAAFAAGFGACKAIEPAAAPPQVASTESTWSPLARQANWVPKNECPAYPVSVALSSPGDASYVTFDSSGDIIMDLVIQTSRPIPDNNSIGLITNFSGAPNFILTFPYFDASSTRSIFRKRGFYFKPAPGAAASDQVVNMWAIIVDDAKKFGSTYSSLDQIKGGGSDIVLSPKTTVIAHK